MKVFLLRYRAYIIGLLLVALATVIFSWLGYILINPSAYGENILIFSFWWLMFSLPIHHWQELKQYRKFFLQVLILIVFCWLTVFADGKMQIPDNPITFLSLTALSLGAFAILAPSFFRRYGKGIVAFYTLLFCYFLGARLFIGDFSAYTVHKDFILPLFFLPIPFVVVTLIYDQWKWLQDLKREKASAELAMLKSQINPHFFFNTLNNLHALTVRGAKEAPDLILRLGDMMRYTIYEGKKDKVSLSEEVDYLNAYLELNRIRYRQTVTLDFYHQIERGATVAPLLFIILLENAFKHGVEKKMNGAYVNIVLASTGDRIDFTVENNFDVEETSTHPGIGLENLRRRLELTYPDQYQLDLRIQNDTYFASLSITPHD
ncbi:sensor histidine kinase [Neolewinella persica]|uniref:sensor histidine kinase n=1 Tax=Neolewinella persica TaxID=70998 RepID=UPI000367B53C|nr:histidine kinase [Neolewinella persica]